MADANGSPLDIICVVDRRTGQITIVRTVEEIDKNIEYYNKLLGMTKSQPLLRHNLHNIHTMYVWAGLTFADALNAQAIRSIAVANRNFPFSLSSHKDQSKRQ